MPLIKGSSPSVVSSNIKTLVDNWKKDGAIGTSHPVTKKKAIKQAVAVALNKAGKNRNSSPITAGRRSDHRGAQRRISTPRTS